MFFGIKPFTARRARFHQKTRFGSLGIAYSAVRHTACQQMKVGSNALRVNDGHMMIVLVLAMMMTLLFVIYVRRPNHIYRGHHHIISWLPYLT